MTALPKPSSYFYSTPSKNSAPRQKNLRRKIQLDRSSNQTTVQPTEESGTKTFSSQTSQFPQVQHLPANLRVLLLLQKGSLGLALVLISASIAVYVSTVRIPELWSKKYEQLETLQRQERQLTATNESLKHKLAQQAQNQDNNLNLITSNNIIFIAPASLSKSQSNHPQPKINLKNIPMGY